VDPKVSFFFYMGAILCFVIAAIGDVWKYGRRTRRGVAAILSPLAFGLALVVFPTLWTTATIAW
jgi:hypothetical protein